MPESGLFVCQVGNRRRIAPEPLEPGPASASLQPAAASRNLQSLHPRPPKPPASLPNAAGLPTGANLLYLQQHCSTTYFRFPSPILPTLFC